MQNKGVLTGALILTIGGVLAKVFSAVYRIALTRILGGAGIGLYQMVFPLYSLCVVLTSAGIPLAISKVVAKHPDAENSVIKKCVLFTCGLSLLLTLGLVVFCRPLAKIQGEVRIYVCYLLLAPTIIVVGLSSVLRGVNQGRQRFVPSALSNTAEQFVKLVLGLVFSLLFIKKSVTAAIVACMVAIDISEIVGLLILLFFVRRRKRKVEQKNVPFKEIMRDVLPITFTNILMPVAGFVDSLLVVNLLVVNFSKIDAIFMYGLETGAVGSLVGLPTVFSFAVASVIMPAVTKKGNTKNKFNLSLKIICILTLPFVVLFVFAPKPILMLLYGGRFMNNAGALHLSCGLLRISGLGVLFLAVNQLLSSTLQALEKRRVSVRNLIIAVVVKFAIELILLPTKYFNIYALSLGNTVCYFVVMLLNIFALRKDIAFELSFVPNLLFVNALMLICFLVLINFAFCNFAVLLVFAIAALVYFALLCTTNMLTKKEKAGLKYKLW